MNAMIYPFASANAKIVISSIVSDGNGGGTVAWSRAQNATALTGGTTVTVPTGLMPKADCAEGRLQRDPGAGELRLHLADRQASSSARCRWRTPSMPARAAARRSPARIARAERRCRSCRFSPRACGSGLPAPPRRRAFRPAHRSRPRLKPRAARGRGTVLHIKQPFVGPERAMEPHGVIDAGHLHALVEPADAVRQQAGVEQRHVGGIGQHALLQRAIVGQRRRSRAPRRPDAAGAFRDAETSPRSTGRSSIGRGRRKCSRCSGGT